MKAHYFAATLAALLVGGAIMLKVTDVAIGPPAVQGLMQSEAVHIPAHLVLYGALAALVRVALGPRPTVVLVVVLLVGVAQELAQSALFGRAPGAGELFDLAVDACAALTALWLMRRWPAPAMDVQQVRVPPGER